MRRGMLFRVVAAICVVVYVRQRAARPELIPQVNVQVLAAGLRWTGAGTLDRQRGFRYAGSRRTSAHRAARRGHLRQVRSLTTDHRPLCSVRVAGSKIVLLASIHIGHYTPHRYGFSAKRRFDFFVLSLIFMHALTRVSAKFHRSDYRTHRHQESIEITFFYIHVDRCALISSPKMLFHLPRTRFVGRADDWLSDRKFLKSRKMFWNSLSHRPVGTRQNGDRRIATAYI